MNQCIGCGKELEPGAVGFARIHIQPFIFSFYGAWDLDGRTRN